MAWVLNEDSALKAKFAGLTVSDSNAPAGGRPVPVRFRLPETELANVEFPFILLQYLGMRKDEEREHRGATSLPYMPEEIYAGTAPVTHTADGVVTWNPYDPDASQDTITKSPLRVPDFPIPYNIDYQVTVYCRVQQHANQLIGKLAKIDRIPSRFGYVEVPEDGTVRSLFLTGGPDLDERRDSDGKRLFLISYTVRVATELNLYDVAQINKWVDSVVLRYEILDDEAFETPVPLGFGFDPFGEDPFGDPDTDVI